MKLLKFVNSDAPQTLAESELSVHRLTMKSTKAGGPRAAKTWALRPVSSATQGGYWLLDDQDQPICALNHVVLAVSDDAHIPTSSAMPRGVGAAEVKGVDFRNKMGRQLERSRAEYGATYKTASKSARQMMNAEEVSEKRHAVMTRAREAVAEAIEGGDALPVRNKSKRLKKER